MGVSRIQILTSKITQVCQDIRDIKLRQLLITQSDEEPNVITTSILTNQSDRKNTWGSDRSKPDPPDIHEDRAEGDNGYIYRTPNHLEHDTRNNQEDHGRCPPQLRPTPSGMTPEPLSYPDPSEASGTSSSLPTSLLSPPKKDDIELVALSMYTERPDDLPPFVRTSDPSPAHSTSPPLSRSSHLHDRAINAIPDQFPTSSLFLHGSLSEPP